jgi:predicted metalloprotease with PDZ domain
MASFSATVVKKSKSFKKLGLEFGAVPSKDNSRYIVVLAKVSGTFKKKTFLVPGLEVLKINSTRISSASDAITACEQVQRGHILSVEVRGSLHKAKKSKNSLWSFGKDKEKVGISIKQVVKEIAGTVGDMEDEYQIMVTQVDRSGLFPNVIKGSILHAVNGNVATSFQKTLRWLKTSSSLTLIVLDAPRQEVPVSTSTLPSNPIKMLPISRKKQSRSFYPTSQDKQKKGEDYDEDMNLRVVACIIRPNLSVSLGLTFSQNSDGGVVIDSVSHNGIFANTGIQANQKIVKINGHVCDRIAKHNFDQAIELLQQATGRITIEAEHGLQKPIDDATSTYDERQIFSIQKTKQSLQLGLGLKKNRGEGGALEISEISPTLQKVLGLKEGLKLVRINGVHCPADDIQRVHKQMDQAFPILSLECIKTTSPKTKDNVRVVACIIRPNSSMDLGISFRQDIANGCLIVDKVSPNGLFGNTGIQPNQKILRINGHLYNRISQLKMNQAVKLLEQTLGRLTVETEEVGNTGATRHIFSIQKNNRKFQLGVDLEQIKTSSSTIFRIENVSPTVEKVLGLKNGLELVQINGTPCDTDGVRNVQKQIDRAFPILSMECVEVSKTKPPQHQHKMEEVKDDNEPWMEQEYKVAEKALPIPVNESNKATAKIVRTTIVELSSDLIGANKSALDHTLGLSLAKHQHLNAIVITGISKNSLLTKQLKIGQVFVSINHISCPLSTQSTMKMLRRKIKEGILRIETGDVDYVDPNGFGHRQPSSIYRDYSTDEEERMMHAIEMGMLKATDEIQEEYKYEGHVPEYYEFDMMEEVIADDDILAVELPPELRAVHYEDESPDVISA